MFSLEEQRRRGWKSLTSDDRKANGTSASAEELVDSDDD